MSNPNHDIYSYNPHYFYDGLKYTISDYKKFAELDVKLWSREDINWHDKEQKKIVINGFFDCYADAYPAYSLEKTERLFVFHTNKQLSTLKDFYNTSMDYFQVGHTTGTAKSIASEYPQTVISMNGEYASSGTKGETQEAQYADLKNTTNRLYGEGDINYLLIEYLGDILLAKIIGVDL